MLPVPLKIFVSILLLMLLFTPWWAVGHGGRVGGFPLWVVYVTIGCVVFPVIVAVMISRRWESLAEHGDEEDAGR
jgi:hypothetical protein